MKGPLFRQRVAWLVCLPVRPFLRRTYGKNHLPAGPCVLACSHGSILDGPLIGHAFWPRRMQALVDEEWFIKPLIGTFLRLADSIVVEVAAPGKTVGIAIEAARQGSTIVIFPQGGISGNIVTKPKTGAARIALKAGVPLVPVKLTGSHHIMLRTGFPKMRRTDIIVGKPIDTRGYDADKPADWKRLTAELARRINELGTGIGPGLQTGSQHS